MFSTLPLRRFRRLNNRALIGGETAELNERSPTRAYGPECILREGARAGCQLTSIALILPKQVSHGTIFGDVRF